MLKVQGLGFGVWGFGVQVYTAPVTRLSWCVRRSWQRAQQKWWRSGLWCQRPIAPVMSAFGQTEFGQKNPNWPSFRDRILAKPHLARIIVLNVLAMCVCVCCVFKIFGGSSRCLKDLAPPQDRTLRWTAMTYLGPILLRPSLLRPLQLRPSLLRPGQRRPGLVLWCCGVLCVLCVRVRVCAVCVCVCVWGVWAVRVLNT